MYFTGIGKNDNIMGHKKEKALASARAFLIADPL